MRIYYIFFIKDNIYKETKDDPYKLYKILEEIYFMNNEDAVLGKKMFDKLLVNIDKNNINKLIKSIHENNLNYINFKYTHVINDFFQNENTKLIVNNFFIKVKSTNNYPIFFKDIKNMKNVFVCDFINLDYFYMKNFVFS